MTTYNYKFDQAHSEIGFIARHMVFAKVRGTFSEWSGEFRFDEENPSNGFVRAEIDTASISTNNEDRDQHLRSADFFDVEEHPTMTFISTSWQPNGADEYEVHGDLTIRGTTRPVTVLVTENGTGVDPWGNTRLLLSARATIDRKEFGLTWNQALETGGVLVGDEIKVEIEVQAIQAEKAESNAA